MIWVAGRERESAMTRMGLAALAGALALLGGCGGPKTDANGFTIDPDFEKRLQQQLLDAKPGDVVTIPAGKYKMTHYAFCTALMNLVLVPTQMVSGPLADWLGYRSFFVFVLFASLPSIVVAWRAPFPNPPDVEEPEEQAPAEGQLSV